MKVLIVGGYGVFGGRLARLLADERQVRLVIAGRSAEKAQAFCASQLAGANCEAARFDREGDVTAQLRQIGPDVIVDASGPFQAYGTDPYRLVRAAMGLGISYLDLADGADFVEGVAAFDREARPAGVSVLSGVSSFPVLTAAVVRALSEDLESIDSVEAGIAPSPYAGVGENVIRAIAGYSGKPVKLRRGGRDAYGHGMAESRRYVIRPPGCVPLPSLRFSLVDVPDLRVLPKLWPELAEVWIGAGPVPESLHRMLNGLALLVRWRVLPSLRPFGGLFYRAINILRWGEHRGGMYVEIKGQRGGEAVTRS
ncbi:saccharopine dehydrogenase NADP-binding domain-containing protein, partial [Phenylobacterium sp.]|uniref:saccharopine dehydrogenase NADP-binding domain-containing protein n=1 Tax=Phenylobacterium sp. TaxID=1871053 RepID=UPI002E3065BD